MPAPLQDITAALPVLSGTGAALIAPLSWVGSLLLLPACWTDLAARRISNTIVLALLPFGLLRHWLEGDLLTALGLTVAIFAVVVAGWRAGLLGGGDTKLLTAAALLMPSEQLPLFLALTALGGGALALSIIAVRPMAPMMVPAVVPAGRAARRCNPATTLRRVWNIELWRLRHGGSLPYALAITTGAMLTLWMSGG